MEAERTPAAELFEHATTRVTYPLVRSATSADLRNILELYNYYVRETPITFDLEPRTIEDRREWFRQFSDRGRHRLFVAEVGGQFVGYASSTRFRPKAAYDTTVETTIYVEPGYQGKGIGRALYAALFDALAAEDVHRAMAVITLPNDRSIAVHERFGFEYRGTMPEVGRKFDRYWDVAYYEKAMR